MTVTESRGRFDLLPANILLRLHGIEPLDYVALRCFAIHIENGAQKYSERNWEKEYTDPCVLQQCFQTLFETW